MRRRMLVCALGFAAALLMPAAASAHCDGLDGPVVNAARKALETGNVSFALMWVQERDEPEIKSAFERTMKVRGLGGDARSLADTYFFETLVRVHRAGEGAAYTGLKPAGRDLGPAIPAADKALESGSPDALIALIRTAIDKGIREQFEHALHARHGAAGADVAAGRRFVAAYVPFIHYVERLYDAAVTTAHGHASEPHDR